MAHYLFLLSVSLLDSLWLYLHASCIICFIHSSCGLPLDIFLSVISIWSTRLSLLLCTMSQKNLYVFNLLRSTLFDTYSTLFSIALYSTITQMALFSSALQQSRFSDPYNTTFQTLHLKYYSYFLRLMFFDVRKWFFFLKSVACAVLLMLIYIFKQHNIEFLI